MRFAALALGIALVMGAGASAQPAAPADSPPKIVDASGHYTTSLTDIGTLLADPASKAVLDKNLPNFSSNPQVDAARSMTLRDVQQYAPDQMTDKVLLNIDAGLARLPPKTGRPAGQ